jgi:ABC-2 type transport system permease protein
MPEPSFASQSLGPLGLIRLRRLPALRRGLRVQSAGQALRLLAFGLLGVFFLAMLGSIFKPLCAFLWNQPQLGPALSARLLSLFFSLLLCLFCFSSLLGLLGRLLDDEDAALYVASPWPPQRWYEACLWETALASTWMMLLLWLPYLWALRRAAGASWLWLGWGCLVPLPLVGLAVGGTALGLGLLLKLLPPRGLRRFLFAVGALAGLGLLLALRLSRPERLADPEVAGTAAAYLASLDRLEPWWWPATWSSRALMQALDDPLAGLVWWLPGLAAAVLAWKAAVAAWGPGAWRQWQQGQEHSVGQAARSHRAFLNLRTPQAALFQREAVAFWRSPGQGLQMLLLGTLCVLFVVSLDRLPVAGDRDLQAILYPPVCVVAQVILLAVCARFAFPSASLEKPGAWLLLHAPLDAKDHLRARLRFHGLLLLGLALVLDASVLNALRPSLWPAVLGSLQFLLAAPSLAILGVGLGVAWAKDGVGSAEEALGSASGVLAMVLGFLMLLLQQALLSVSYREAALCALLPQHRVNWAVVVATLGLWLASHGAVWIWCWRAGMRGMEDA